MHHFTEQVDFYFFSETNFGLQGLISTGYQLVFITLSLAKQQYDVLFDQSFVLSS